MATVVDPTAPGSPGYPHHQYHHQVTNGPTGGPGLAPQDYLSHPSSSLISISSGFLFKVIVVLLVSLLLANSLLFYKMFNLETRLVTDQKQEELLTAQSELRLLESLQMMEAGVAGGEGAGRPPSTEAWLKILRKQEMLHQMELQRFHEMLGAATELLRKVSGARFHSLDFLANFDSFFSD